MRGVVFIGAVNANNLPLGGEEYKNQLIVSYFGENVKGFTVIDTFHWKKSIKVKVELIYHVFLRNYKTVVISASSVSTYKLLVLISKIKPNVKKKIVYLVIGGYLPDAIGNGIFKKNVYNGLKSIVVEGELLKQKLTNYDLKTPIYVIPNFKNFPILEIPEKQNNEVFKFVYIGRINRAKGIDEIIQAANRIQANNRKPLFEVDFYGPVEDEFDFSGVCTFKGYLNFISEREKAYSTLASHDCLLFPTTWQGEGFPGVIIDAYAAALPVIATDWNMNSEIICNEKNGFLISNNHLLEELVDKMIYVLENREHLENIRQNNFKESVQYHTNMVLPKLLNCVLQ